MNEWLSDPVCFPGRQQLQVVRVSGEFHCRFNVTEGLSPTWKEYLPLKIGFKMRPLFNASMDTECFFLLFGILKCLILRIKQCFSFLHSLTKLLGDAVLAGSCHVFKTSQQQEQCQMSTECNLSDQLVCYYLQQKTALHWHTWPRGWWWDFKYRLLEQTSHVILQSVSNYLQSVQLLSICIHSGSCY